MSMVISYDRHNIIIQFFQQLGISVDVLKHLKNIAADYKNN